MNYPLQMMIQMGAIPSVNFPTNSRYYNSATLQFTAADGTQIAYLARRFVPQPVNFTQVAQYTVQQGDRLDLLAAKYLGDPLLFWLICDANGAINPGQLVSTPGATLSITLPQGVPGVSNA